MGDYARSLPPTVSAKAADSNDTTSSLFWSFDQGRLSSILKFQRLNGLPPNLPVAAWFRLPRVDATHELYAESCWTLRNLSKRTFVKEPSIRYDSNLVKGRGLGHVLALRCCWSDDPSAAISISGLDYELTRGPWAGDHLDVVVFDEDADWAKQWEDVSQSASNDMKKLFGAW